MIDYDIEAYHLLLKDPEFKAEYTKRLKRSFAKLSEKMEQERKAQIMTPEMLNRTYTL
ncbi:Hypothetical protein KNT65_gp196 [Escherichia phage EcS1]|uniref:Uncharacterized protein n=1 Tax=Escherichia phage EcS1 TaxID=2083276 RepID=A0A2Z5ZCT5_9CAUD|nr:Hypothetical protein KNT65_gp196 [Escherichia phage EcS1]BBC78297.1 Hypothetical protein [Escherichia phage EcS1]